MPLTIYLDKAIISKNPNAIHPKAMDGREPGGDDRPSLSSRYRASMVLAGVGDAMGYRNGAWEFTFDGSFPLFLFSCVMEIVTSIFIFVV